MSVQIKAPVGGFAHNSLEAKVDLLGSKLQALTKALERYSPEHTHVFDYFMSIVDMNEDMRALDLPFQAFPCSTQAVPNGKIDAEGRQLYGVFTDAEADPDTGYVLLVPTNSAEEPSLMGIKLSVGRLQERIALHKQRAG
jgi:hypothetical protein